ncbi:MAG TPA: helix-turn-helix domain-containing protein [Candidatus Eremiobacteraceae bacterium]|nr:helix-turn-helix domain-containing protein [Candidatus Eremiobacteraceae bacterium]
MREASFFQTTRGRIVQSLKRYRTRTAAQLASEQGVSANAIRQHLAHLEGDGLVSGRSERLGRTKPTYVYSLTAEGERLFPQRYPLLLNAVLDQLQRDSGPEALRDLFRAIGRRSAQRHAKRFDGKDRDAQVAELVEFLRERGVMAEGAKTADGYILREYNCPFRDAVATHPEVCSVVHGLMQEVLHEPARQTRSLARGDDRCEFDLPLSADRSAAKTPVLAGEV